LSGIVSFDPHSITTVTYVLTDVFQVKLNWPVLLGLFTALATEEHLWKK